MSIILMTPSFIFLSYIFLSLTFFSSLLFGKSLHRDRSQRDIDPKRVFQIGVFQEPQSVRLKILQRAGKRREFEGGIGSHKPHFLAADATSIAHNLDLPHDAILAAEKVRQGIDVKLQIKPGAPVPQKRLDEAPYFRRLLYRGIPSLVIDRERRSVGMSERCVHKLVLDKFRPKIDQFAVAASGEHQVIQELRPMLVVQTANRLQLENGAVIDEQVDGVRFAKIGVFDQNTRFNDRAWLEHISQFVLISVLAQKTPQLVMDAEGMLHHLERNRSERLLIKSTDVFA
jgi:hypothetical protein